MNPEEVEALEKLSNLRKTGAIDEAEFERIKSGIINKRKPASSEGSENLLHSASGDGDDIDYRIEQFEQQNIQQVPSGPPPGYQPHIAESPARLYKFAVALYLVALSLTWISTEYGFNFGFFASFESAAPWFRGSRWMWLLLAPIVSHAISDAGKMYRRSTQNVVRGGVFVALLTTFIIWAAWPDLPLSTEDWIIGGEVFKEGDPLVVRHLIVLLLLSSVFVIAVAVAFREYKARSKSPHISGVAAIKKEVSEWQAKATGRTNQDQSETQGDA